MAAPVHFAPPSQASAKRPARQARHSGGGPRHRSFAGLLALALASGGSFGLSAAPQPQPSLPAAGAVPREPEARPWRVLLPAIRTVRIEPIATPLPGARPERPQTPVPATPSKPTATPTPDRGYLLPDLQTISPQDLYIAVDPESGERTMRFGTTVVNLGAGPLEMAGTYDPATDRTRAIQRIHTREGAIVEHFVGSFVFHPDHNHWHFEDFTVFELWSYAPDGTLQDLVATTGKMSFCLTDSEPVTPAPPEAPPHRVVTRCGGEVQGISVGWADIYDSSVRGQRLEIGGVPDGRYAVRSTADPDDRIMETDDTNNAAIAYVELQGTNVRVLAGP